MTHAPQTRRTGIALTGMACAALGWALGSWQSAGSDGARPDAATQATRPAPAAPMPAPSHLESASLVAVASDGRVTLHVDQQPLPLVLEEIQRQSGGLPPCTDGVERAGHAGAAKPAAPPPAVAAPRTAAATPPATARDPDPMGTLLRGSEPERYGALHKALGGGGGVPESVLKTLFETDGSPRVRLLAFEASLEAHAGDLAALRGALESAQHGPDAVLVQDAMRRLDELGRTPAPDTVPQVAPER